MERWLMNYKEFRKKWLWPTWGTIPAFTWMNWGNQLKISVRISGALANTQTHHLLNTFPNHYLYASLSGFSAYYYRLCGLVVRVSRYRSRGPGFDSQRYQIFWEVMGLERSPLNLLSTTEELLGRNSSGSGLENREYSCGDLLRWPRDTIYPQKVGTNFADMRRSLGRYSSLAD
jgi:hypothetical protein